MSAASMLDAVKYHLKLKNDAALARVLQMSPAAISNARSDRKSVGAALIVTIHEETGWSSRKIKALVAGGVA